MGTQLLGDVRNLITLAAMRCIMRTFTAVPKADEQCVEIMSKVARLATAVAMVSYPWAEISVPSCLALTLRKSTKSSDAPGPALGPPCPAHEHHRTKLSSHGGRFGQRWPPELQVTFRCRRDTESRRELMLCVARGLVDPKDMNGLLGEIGEQLASRTLE